MAQRTSALARFVRSLTAGAALLAAGTGCEKVAPSSSGGGGDLGAVVQEEFPMCSDITLYKRSRNGICQNGLAAAGLTDAGLGDDGVSTPEFATWFDANAEGHDTLMRYLVKCAAPQSQVLEWTSPNTQITYRWEGGLGLATGWANGDAMTGAEQQLLSACLAAHVNKYGRSVPLAVEGRTSGGEPMSLDPGELNAFPVREGCFFGNLFAGEPAMVGLDHEEYGPEYSSIRACAFSPQEPGTTSVACPPMVYAGKCQELCVATEDPLNPGLFYETCTYGGKTYLPVNTRLRHAELNACGDGICQVSESCGTGTTADSCLADCGPCPP